jgi:hypothetical protein
MVWNIHEVIRERPVYNAAEILVPENECNLNIFIDKDKQKPKSPFFNTWQRNC